MGDPLPPVPRAVRKVRLTYRQSTKRARSLPDFVIIGAQKAGTTSLYRYLRAHPDVILDPDVHEVHYFDRDWDRGELHYRSHFPLGVRIQAQRKYTGRTVMTGEKSPYYMFHPLVPERAARTIPDAKLIAILRNPIERAASHHQMSVRRGQEDLSFADAVRAEDERVQPALEALRRGERPPHRGGSANWHSYVSRGQYLEQLDRWLEHFPREQLLVLRSEDLYERPAETYGDTLRFLELAPHEQPFKTYNASPNPYDVDPRVRDELESRFEESNRGLAERFDLKWS